MLYVFVYFMCFLLLINAFTVILSENPVYSIIFCILSFFCLETVTFLFSNDEFLILLFLAFCCGSIAVLFLFITTLFAVEKLVIWIKL